MHLMNNIVQIFETHVQPHFRAVWHLVQQHPCATQAVTLGVAGGVYIVDLYGRVWIRTPRLTSKIAMRGELGKFLWLRLVGWQLWLRVSCCSRDMIQKFNRT